MYPSGPRARDKLGHGEVDLSDVPQEMCQVLMSVFGYLAQRVAGAHGQVFYTDSLYLNKY